MTTHDKKTTPEISMQATDSSEKSLTFQLFFLCYDENQNVEVVETEELDLGEIVQRLRKGESVFIKNKSQDNIESGMEIVREGKDDSWYFTRC